MVSNEFQEAIMLLQGDSIHGAIFLTNKLLDTIKKEIERTESVQADIEEIIQAAGLVHPEMTSIVKIVKALEDMKTLLSDDAEADKKTVLELLNDLDKSLSASEGMTAQSLKEEISKYNSLMTISTSTTIRTALALIEAENREKEIYVLESRPLFEGRNFAKQISGMNYDVKLIVDAAAGHYMKRVEAVVIGADSIFPDGSVINKIGSLVLALLAREYNIPFIVAASRNKRTTEAVENYGIYLQEKPEKEVFDEEITNLKPKNIYLDFIPTKLITKLISE